MDKIFMKTKSGESVDIPIYDKITTITGNSATGKTKMLEFIKACKKVAKTNPAEIIETTIDLEDVWVITDSDMLSMLIEKKVSHKVIFIDRFTLMWSPEVIEFIRTSENIFILLGHRTTAELSGMDAVWGLRHDGKTYECYQIYQNGIMNPIDKI